MSELEHWAVASLRDASAVATSQKIVASDAIASATTPSTFKQSTSSTIHFRRIDRIANATVLRNS